MSLNKKILVIGGGFAGARVTQDLAKAGFEDITLVDKKNYFEVTYAAMRAIADPELGLRSRRAYADFIKGRFVQGIVDELTSSQALLTDGSQLDFDIAVIATGSSYAAFPIGKSQNAMTLKTREAEVSAAHDQLKVSDNILIVGGGIVGVELAGEIAAHYPGKSVKLVHSADRLLLELKPKASKIAAAKLKSLGVEIIYNTRTSDGDEHYRDADLIYTCIGLTPNTGLMTKNFPAALNEQNRLKVDRQFRVEGTDNIFALGDCANVAEGKLGYLADVQATALAKNIIAIAKGKSPKDYKTKPMMALVPIGPKHGLVQLPFGVTTLGFMVNMKQKDMFISKSFKQIGASK